MNTTISTLPIEILVKILEYVEIAQMPEGGRSYLGDLFKCSYCYILELKKCVHIHGYELEGAHNLRLVCKDWNETIKSHFKYQFWKSVV
jgi:hypothetical protein